MNKNECGLRKHEAAEEQEHKGLREDVTGVVDAALGPIELANRAFGLQAHIWIILQHGLEDVLVRIARFGKCSVLRHNHLLHRECQIQHICGDVDIAKVVLVKDLHFWFVMVCAQCIDTPSD